MSSSTVTYTSVFTDSKTRRFQWVSDEEPKAPAEAPPSPDYVSGPEHPPSLDYVPGPEEPEQAPLSLDYVPEPEYPEYLPLSDAEAPMEDHPLPDDASLTALSSGYVADSYPADGGHDANEESSDDNDDDDDDDDDHDDDDDVHDDDEQETSEDEDEEKEGHSAPTDSFTISIHLTEILMLTCPLLALTNRTTATTFYAAE
ncbi:hypothetical protein Tco_0915464 [Tanacetum coccineum]